MIVLLVLIIATSLFSQDTAKIVDSTSIPIGARDEFDLIAAAHRSLKAYDLQINAEYSSGGSSQSLQARVACDGSARCLRVFQNSTTLETPSRSLLINATDRTITVAVHEQVTVESPQAINDPTQTLATWLKGGGTLSGGEVTSEGRRWAFRRSRLDPSETQIYVDERTYLLRRLIYGSTTDNRVPAQVDIRYAWNDISHLDPSEFDITHYIEERGVSITPARNYAEYRIVRADRP